jgi:hypothetical protein
VCARERIEGVIEGKKRGEGVMMCEGGKDEDDKRLRTEVNIDRKRS